MSTVNASPSLDDVCEELFGHCPSLTHAQVCEWCERYPQFADDILEMSTDLLCMQIAERFLAFTKKRRARLASKKRSTIPKRYLNQPYQNT